MPGTAIESGDMYMYLCQIVLARRICCLTLKELHVLLLYPCLCMIFAISMFMSEFFFFSDNFMQLKLIFYLFVTCMKVSLT